MKGSIGTSLKGRMIIIEEKKPKELASIKQKAPLFGRLDSIAKSKSDRLSNKKRNRSKKK